MSKMTAGPPGCGVPVVGMPRPIDPVGRLAWSGARRTSLRRPQHPRRRDNSARIEEGLDGSEGDTMDGEWDPKLTQGWKRVAAATAGRRPHAPGGPRPKGGGHRRPPAPARAHRQLARRLSRHRPTTRGVAGTGHRDPVRAARGAGGSPTSPAGVVEKHADLTDALGAFAARADSQVIVVHGSPPSSDPALVAGAGASWRDGARRRRSRMRDRCRHAHRARTRRDAATRQQSPHGRRTLRRPALAGRHGASGRSETRRAASSPRGCCTAGCAATSGRRRWRLAVIALLLRVEFVVDGLGRVFRTPRQQTALATGLQRHLAFALHRDRRDRPRPAGHPRPRGRHHVAWHLAGARWRRVSRLLGPAVRRAPGPSRTSSSSWTAVDALDATRAAVESGVSGVIVGGALVPELTHLDTGFFACPGSHLRGRARAPGSPRAPAHVPAPPPGVDPRDRDRGGAARPPAAGRGRSAARHHGGAARHRRHRRQGSLQGGRRPRRSWRPAGRAARRGRPRPRWRRTTSGCAASAASPRSCCSWPAPSTCSPRSRLPCASTCTSLRSTCPSRWCRRPAPSPPSPGSA